MNIDTGEIVPSFEIFWRRFQSSVMRPPSSKRVLEISLWVLLGVFSLSIFPVTTIDFKPDSTRYFVEAYRLYSDLSYERSQRGPMMAAYGGIAFLISGGDPLAVLPLPRVAFLAAVVAFAGLVRSLFGGLAAVPATLAFALLPILHEISTHYHVDVFLVAMSLFALWAHYVAMQRRSLGLSALSGALLGLAFLTKEVAILFVPFWLLSWLLFPPYDRRLRTIVVAGVVAATLVVLPWALYVAIDTGAGDLMGRNVNRSGSKFGALTHLLLDKPVQFVTQVPLLVFKFYSTYLVRDGEESNFGFSVLIVAGQILAACRAFIWRSIPDAFVTLAFICFVPLIIYLGLFPFDVRQSAIIQSIAALSLGSFLPSIASMASTLRAKLTYAKLGASVAPSIIACLLLVAVVTVVGVTTPSVRRSFEDGPRSYALYGGTGYYFEPRLHVSRTVLEGGYWLRQHLRSGEGVMTTSRRDARQLATTLPDDAQLAGLPWGYLNLKYWRMEVDDQADQKHGKVAWAGTLGAHDFSSNTPRRVILLWMHRPDQWQQCITEEDVEIVPEHYCRINFVDETLLFDFIRGSKTKYIVDGEKFSVMRDYYDQNPSFRRVAEFSGNIPYSDEPESVIIYEVVATRSLLSFEPIVSKYVPEMLRTFDADRPKEFARWQDEVLGKYLNLSQSEQRQIYDGNSVCFQQDNARSHIVDCAE